MAEPYRFSPRAIARSIFQSKYSRWIFTIAAFIFSTGVLALLLYRQREILQHYQWRINWEAAAGAFAVYSVDLFMVVAIWVWIVTAMGAIVNLRKHFQYYCISNLARRLPGTVWYIAYRAQVYKDEGLSAKLTSLGSGIELAISIVSATLVCFVFSIPILLHYRIGLIPAVILMAISLAFLHPRLLSWIIKKLGGTINQIRYTKMLLWIGGYLLIWIAGGILLYFIGNIIYPLPLNQLPYIIGCYALVGLLSRALLFSPSNLGFTEVSLSLLLTSIMPSSMAVLVSVMNRIVVTFFDILWALIAFVWSKLQMKGN